MVLYRPLRGELYLAMKEVKEVNTWQELLDVLEDYTHGTTITIKPYSYDKRINWDTWIVLSDGQACGFTNGELTPDN